MKNFHSIGKHYPKLIFLLFFSSFGFGKCHLDISKVDFGDEIWLLDKYYQASIEDKKGTTLSILTAEFQSI